MFVKYRIVEGNRERGIDSEFSKTDYDDILLYENCGRVKNSKRSYRRDDQTILYPL